MESFVHQILLLGFVMTGCVRSASISVKPDSTLKLHKRSSELSLLNPCNVVDEDTPVSPADFSTILADLKIRADGLKLSSVGIKETIEDEGLLSNMYLNWIRSAYFTDESSVTKTEDIIQIAETESVTTLQSHVRLVYEVIKYINASRKTGALSEDGFPLAMTQLKNLETAMYDCLCDIKIALRSQSSDIYEGIELTLNKDFLGASSPIQYEYMRLYILMNDSERMSDFLYSMYEHMYNHVTNA